MPTSNISVTSAWTQLATASNTELLATYTSPALLELATTSADVSPTVEGHRICQDDQLTRTVVGTGFVWVKLRSGAIQSSINMIVTK